jgi:hypothetical protein
MKFKNLRALVHAALAAVLVACGGGGDGGIGGTGAADVSVGGITAFGSVWVNGVEFKTSGATTIRIDDTPHPESDLRVGMVARVDGSIANATASAITVTSAVKGYVESVAANQMVVMGQTVVTGAGTTIANGPILAGQYVEVHGQVAADGTIAANFVERKTTLAQPPFVVKGLIKNHAAGGTTFAIGNLAITLGAGAITNDMPAGSWTGVLAEVKGTACAGNPPASNVCGTLTASKVEPEGVRGNVARIEVEGFVTAFASASSFTVGSQPVVTTAGTVFQGGLASEIVLGAKLEVEGSLSNGVLTATKVSFRENVRFEANIAGINGTSLTLAGLPGITVETNALTQFKNRALNQLAVGHSLRIRGRPGAGNTVIALEVEFRSTTPDTRVILQAVARAVASPNVTLLGFVVDTSAIPDNAFKDVNDAVIGRAAFFAAAAPGRLIKARGTLVGNTIVFGAQDGEIQFED